MDRATFRMPFEDRPSASAIGSDWPYPGEDVIAVVGYACRFPEAGDSSAFWRNLLAGHESSTRLSRQQLLAAGFDSATIDAPNFVNVASVLEDAEVFDAGLFGYARSEAEALDPQQRLFLQIVWHALEHAGFAPAQVMHRTGVFASARMSTYPGQERLSLRQVSQVSGLQSLLGNDKDYLATRVAYKLNLRGPALSVQTACSSSLVAVHLACESLRSGESEMAVAGGVALSFPQHSGYLHQPGMIFSPDGRCRPFDARAQGTFAGNGVAAVVLRRLADALADGDPVLALLPASAMNNDGNQKVGYTAPSVAGQREVIRAALAEAGIDTTQVGLIEAHGTATPLGDPIEVQALRAVFHPRDDGPPCALGSVKGNLGHLDSAAGIASLLKAIMAVQHGVIPPSLHFEQPNPALELAASPFYVPTTAQPWSDATRIGGVSSFGIGGTNCHVLVSSLPPPLQQALSARDAQRRQPQPAAALLLSAASESALRQLAGAYAQALQAAAQTPQQLHDLAYTALYGRQLDLEHRLALPLCATSAQALAAYAEGRPGSLLQHGQGVPGKLVWLCSGQGSQWAGMGQALHAHSAPFAQTLERCLQACGKRFGSILREAMWTAPAHRLAQMELAQPAVVAFQIAMAAHWRAQGLEPQLLIGHGVGEYAAAVIAGHYAIEQIMPLVCSRGRLMQQAMPAGGGGLLSATGEPAMLLALAAAYQLDLAAENGPQQLVFSGPRSAIEACAQALRGQGTVHTRLRVAGATHSALLDPIRSTFAEELAGLQAEPGSVPMISTLSGELLSAAQLNAGQADYWCRQLREPVRYAQALQQAQALGAGVFLELGADATLTTLARQAAPVATSATAGWRWIASASRSGRQAPEQLQKALLQLYAAGIALPWQRLLPLSGCKVQAPLYTFDTERYWRQAGSAPAALGEGGSGAPDLALEEGLRVAAQAAASLDLPRLQALYDCVTPLHAIYLDRLLHQCVGARLQAGVSALEILRGGRLLPRYQQLLGRLLNNGVADGYYQCSMRAGVAYYAPLRPVPHERCTALLEQLRNCCEGLDVIAATAARAGEQLYAMLRGAQEPVAVIFPESSSTGVEVLYQEFSFGRYFNQIAAGVVAGLRRQHPAHAPLRILEVGGGTGGTSAWLLPELCGMADLRYDFTDISALFTRRASVKFAAYDFIRYEQFDLEQSATGQGFAAASYDLIVAANVIHATRHIGRCLENLHALLKPGGRLLLREITRPMRLFDFVFGALVAPLEDQAERGGELFLSATGWQQHCLAAGFAQVDCLPAAGSPTASISEHIILARTPVAATVAATLPQTLSLPSESGSQDPLLGQPLSTDGSYLADWSDCAQLPQRWQTRLQQASEELARRHGSAQKICLDGLPARPPPELSLVRLRWLAEPFGQARMQLETCGHQGHWQVQADTAAGVPLPLSQAAPDTHYTWCWRHALLLAVSPAAEPECYQLLHQPPGLVAALSAAGLSVTASAAGSGQLLLLEQGSQHLSDLLAPLLHALSSGSAALTVVTRAAWSVADGAAVDPLQQAVWGLLRVAAAEQPQRRISAIDLAPQAPWSALLCGLSALRAGARWAAVRDAETYVPYLRQQEHAAAVLPLQTFCGPRWHLVTGGFGALGRLSVEWLARHGARRIAIVAVRCHADYPDWQRRLASQYGCQLHYMQCDLAAPQQLTQLLASLEADGGVMGAIHAAGILDDTPLAQLNVSRIAAVCAPKAEAARILCTALRQQHSRYLLLYSSAAAALGAAGQGAHAFASGYLDGLAQQAAGWQAEDAGPALMVASIAWGAWGEVGRTAEPLQQQRLAASGMGLLDNAEGLWHLEQAIMRGASYRLAMRILPAQLAPWHRALFDQKPDLPDLSTAIAAASLPLPATDDAAGLVRWLTVRIASQLRLAAATPLSPTQDLLQLGLDSLLFLELRSDIERQLGVRLDSVRAYEDLSIAGLAALIVAAASTPLAVSPALQLSHDAGQRYAPFPLTPIQHAYWLGRTSLIDYGGVACHVLFEWDLRHAAFDLSRFEAAWNRLIAHHDMLRMVIDSDGCQRILPQVPHYAFARQDLRELDPAARQQALLASRASLCARVLPSACWPLFELLVSELDEQHYRLHMHLDLLLFDVQSFKVMLDDLARLYQGQTLTPLSISYRDYVMAEQARRSQPDWQQSWQYWRAQLAQLPPAPQLPLADSGKTQAAPAFSSYQGSLEASAWSRLKRLWKDAGVTSSAALLGLFAQTLERYSRQPAFTLNLTFFNRRDEHPQVAQLIGDFTSVLLVDFHLHPGQTLRSVIEQTQQRLWQHLAHSQVNGVEVMRELGRYQGQQRQPSMPVVFTSMLGMTLDGLSIDQAMTGLLGDPVYVFTQTPQVWLDHQVMEINGALVWNWYCMDGVLEEGCAAAMFADYQRLLDGIVAQPQRLDDSSLSGLCQDGHWQPLRHRAWPLLVAGRQHGPDLREIEQLVRAQPGVGQAQARWCALAQRLEISVVAAEPAVAAPDRRADSGSDSVPDSALPSLDASQLDEVEASWHWLDARAQQGMLASLQQHGCFLQPGQAHTLDEVQARLAALPGYRRLLRQWLLLLAERGILRRAVEIDGERFICIQVSPAPSVPAPSLPQAGWSQTLAAYLEQSIGAHAALFNGSQSALTLLFGASEADAQVARAFYSDNPVIDCLHRSAARIVAALAVPGAAMQVLEVGAGIGAATCHLLPALAGRLQRYRYTDVSPLFLQEARAHFSGHAELEYGLFDLNAPLDFSAHPLAGYDLIAAINVLHDASDVPCALRRLHQLLKPGGHLLMIEATTCDSALQLASIGFIEGLNAYQDFRSLDEKTMLDLPTWQRLLEQSGFAVVRNWPRQADTPWRQHLILARAGQQPRLAAAQIEQTLQAHYGAALPALMVQQSERLALAAGTALPQPAPATVTVTTAAAPADPARQALEQQVAMLWQELLACPVQRDSDFFQSGGDSLIATRMVARLNRSGIAGAALAALFAQPRLADFCATLGAPAAQAQELLLLASGQQPQQAFVFHAADGELAAYLPLASALDCQVYGLRATDISAVDSLEQLAGAYVAALRRQQPEGPYLLLGWSYGAFLAAAAAARLHADGAALQLVLLDPVCRADLHYADQDGLRQLLAQGRNAHQSAPSLESPAALARIARLLDLLVRHPAPSALPLPCLWLTAAARPSHWQAAEQDWQDWVAASERLTLAVDHWSLLLDEGSARECAQRITQWQQRQAAAAQTRKRGQP